MSARTDERRKTVADLAGLIDKHSDKIPANDPSANMIGLVVSLGVALLEALVDIGESLEPPEPQIALRPMSGPEVFLGIPHGAIPGEIMIAWLHGRAEERDQVVDWACKWHEQRAEAEKIAKEVGPIGAAPAQREFKAVSPRNRAERFSEMHRPVPGKHERAERQLHPGMPLCPHNSISKRLDLGPTASACNDCGKQWSGQPGDYAP